MPGTATEGRVDVERHDHVLKITIDNQAKKTLDYQLTPAARKPNDADATLMLGRCLSKAAPRSNDPKRDGLERLKLNFEETAYRQLKAELKVK